MTVVHQAEQLGVREIDLSPGSLELVDHGVFEYVGCDHFDVRSNLLLIMIYMGLIVDYLVNL